MCVPLKTETETFWNALMMTMNIPDKPQLNQNKNK